MTLAEAGFVLVEFEIEIGKFFVWDDFDGPDFFEVFDTVGAIFIRKRLDFLHHGK
jgi:hypothetical protein